jgi:hypothetical protein
MWRVTKNTIKILPRNYGYDKQIHILMVEIFYVDWSGPVTIA